MDRIHLLNLVYRFFAFILSMSYLLLQSAKLFLKWEKALSRFYVVKFWKNALLYWIDSNRNKPNTLNQLIWSHSSMISYTNPSYYLSENNPVIKYTKFTIICNAKSLPKCAEWSYLWTLKILSGFGCSRLFFALIVV